VFYTQAMSLAPNDPELLTVCLANRAACNLKLGRLDEALEDANACLELDPVNVKGWFRKGMALHAMKSFGPAVAALSKAHDLEPKNKQVNEAIGFAKVLLAKQFKEEQESMR
jgi:stress-induced-phosphoprotein 1